MVRSETVKRYLFMILGMFITTLGVAICVRPSMGISPVVTLPYAMHSVVPSLSLGTFTFFLNVVFLILTAVLLGKSFPLYQLLQIPCSFLFGAFVDFWEMLLRGPVPTSYAVRLLLLLLGCTVIGLGFSLIVNSGVAIESNTAFVNALSFRTGKPYGTMKMVCDLCIVILASVISLLFLHTVVGVREGTVISALIIGPIAGFFNRRLTGIERIFTSKQA